MNQVPTEVKEVEVPEQDVDQEQQETQEPLEKQYGLGKFGRGIKHISLDL